jgi:hypothetical protein
MHAAILVKSLASFVNRKVKLYMKIPANIFLRKRTWMVTHGLQSFRQMGHIERYCNGFLKALLGNGSINTP